MNFPTFILSLIMVAIIYGPGFVTIYWIIWRKHLVSARATVMAAIIVVTALTLFVMGAAGYFE